MSVLVYIGFRSEYRVEDPRPIAFGRNSVLFQAKDKASNDVVIKEFRDLPDDLKDFYRELSARQILSHHNIVPILDYGSGSEQTNAPFLVMPYCKFGSLQDLLDQLDFIPQETAILVLEQIGLAIDFAHQRGIIHGDIKPSNILFCGTYTHACLSDFGLAKAFPVKAPITKTGPDNAAGTYIYLSPEQVRNSKQLPISDIYALAVVAYQMFTGHLPFKEDLSPYMLLEAIVEGNTIDAKIYNHNLPNYVCIALKKGMAKNIKARPRSAMEFVRLLKGEESGSQRPAGNSLEFWHSLETSQKILVVTGVIAAIATIVASLINILPDILSP